MMIQKKFVWTFLITLVLTLGSFGVSVWGAKMAGLQGDYPENVWEAFTSRAAPAAEIKEVVDLNFKDLQSLTIDAQAADIKIRPLSEWAGDKPNGSIARLELKGRLPALGSASNSEVKYISSARNGAEFEVRVADPKAADVRVSLGRFSMGLTLRVYLPDDFRGRLTVRSLSGDVELRGLDLAQVLASSASGRIKIDQSAIDGLEARTQSGEIKLGVRSDALKAEGMSGDIKIHWSPKTTQRSPSLEATTMSGDLRLQVPSDSNLNVQLKTLSGDLEPGFAGFEIKDEVPGKVAHGKLGNGRGELRASTMSGDLKLRAFAAGGAGAQESEKD